MSIFKVFRQTHVQEVQRRMLKEEKSVSAEETAGLGTKEQSFEEGKKDGPLEQNSIGSRDCRHPHTHS